MQIPAHTLLKISTDKDLSHDKTFNTCFINIYDSFRMCGHCSGRVKKVLEELSGVASAEVSHEAGTAIVTLSADIADEVLKKCVEDQGYTVVG